MTTKERLRGAEDLFRPTSRNQFREIFQPSRIVLGVFPSDGPSGVNVITLCFDMHCSYKPAMFAFAVWRGSHTFSLLERATECVIAVPGERLAKAALVCGMASGADKDKVSICGLTLIKSARTFVPSIRECIANIELRIVQKLNTGDHQLIVGQVLKFGVNATNKERCLLSVGRIHDGYEVLAQKGIHRIAVPRHA